MNNQEQATVIRLKQEYLQLLQEDAALQGAVAKATNKSFATIQRWAAANASQLTMLSALIAIRTFLGLPKSAPLTEHVAIEKTA